jgi:hypothetical protein
MLPCIGESCPGRFRVVKGAGGKQVSGQVGTRYTGGRIRRANTDEQHVGIRIAGAAASGVTNSSIKSLVESTNVPFRDDPPQQVTSEVLVLARNPLANVCMPRRPPYPLVPTSATFAFLGSIPIGTPELRAGNPRALPSATDHSITKDGILRPCLGRLYLRGSDGFQIERDLR